MRPVEDLDPPWFSTLDDFKECMCSRDSLERAQKLNSIRPAPSTLHVHAFSERELWIGATFVPETRRSALRIITQV